MKLALKHTKQENVKYIFVIHSNYIADAVRQEIQPVYEFFISENIITHLIHHKNQSSNKNIFQI